jgi:membrane protease YdiL (CAAX protease family)
MASVTFRAAMMLSLSVMAGANVAANRLPAASVLIGLALTGALAGIARGSRLRAGDLGLARATWPAGLRWGGICAAVVAVGYGVALLIPATRDMVAGPSLGWPLTLLAVFVVIPLGTVVPEEFAFRGVVWGLLRRRSGPRVATLVSSGLFGVWHVAPALAGGAANEAMTGVLGGGAVGLVLRVVGTVVFTGVAGVLLCELRARSDSLLAPMLMHWAVNGFGQIFVQMA